MQWATKGIWILAFLSAAALALSRCGHKSKGSDSIAIPSAAPYAPEGWDGEEDWEENALSVEDLNP